MELSDHDNLIDAWIKCQSSAEGSEDYEKNYWATERVMDLQSEDPQLLWEVILKILERGVSDKVMANLAAGPLESLLAHHGDSFIEKVESLARQNTTFKFLLGGVWQNLMSDEVWRRIEKAREGITW